LLVVAALGALALLPARADAAARPQTAPAWAGTCGLPQASPIWVDYGWPELAPIFGRPGVVVTASGGTFPSEIRAAGARTVYFDLYLNRRVGQPISPADPATIRDKAEKLYAFAAQQMGCADPTIVENELFGAHLVTPWSETNAVYRQNVLTFLQVLAEKGAHPVLLINSEPYTGPDALTWWQQTAAVADIVREAYIPATLTWKQGPIVGNRSLRVAYRRYIGQLTAIGIPPQRLGLMVSFATTKGIGGRNGLEPVDAWLQVAKWQALSARAVAEELGIGSIWTWGWAQWNPKEDDPDKALAACVWLWTRAPAFCDAPTEAGPDFNASRTEGQIRLSPGTQCTVGGRTLASTAIARLQQLTGDRDTAFTALFQRLVESAAEPVSAKEVLAAERSVVATRFNGSRAAYVGALAQARANVTVGRAVLGDELRRARLAADLPARTPSGAQVTTFYRSYPDLLVREVATKKPTPWLGGRKRGLLLSAIAPERLFTGGAQRLWTPYGPLTVRPLGDAAPLGAVPFARARPAIITALKQFSRGEAYERWTESLQARALTTTICAHDDLPQPAAVELSTYIPFLRLS
jgi:hypothetical protein